MFDIDTMLQTNNPGFYRKHPVISRLIIQFYRKVWQEERFRAFEKQFLQKYQLQEADIRLIFEGLDYINFSCEFNEALLENIPKSGPLVIVSNHPNMFDALWLMRQVMKVRLDVKVVGTHVFTTFPGLGKHIISVYKEPERAHETHAAIDKQLENNGIVVFFPSGRLSSLKQGEVRDFRWSSGFLRSAIKHDCDILPFYIELPDKKYARFFRQLLFPYFYEGHGIRMTAGKPFKPEPSNSNEAIRHQVEKIRSAVYKLGENENGVNFP